MNWAEEEFKTMEFGDARLDRRGGAVAGGTAQRRGAQPGGVGLAGQLSQGMRSQPEVLCLQDTTELDFRGQDIEGLGPLSYEAQRGLYLQPTYAVTPGREPLGRINSWKWAREFKPEGDGARPGMLESGHWLEGYERLLDLAAQMSQTWLVYVADRESDLLALMQRAQHSAHAVDYAIRAQHNRGLPGEDKKLWRGVMDWGVLGRIGFEMPAGRGRKARRVQQELHVQRVMLKAPAGAKQDIEVRCLIASEIDAPARARSVVWRLLSNRAVDTLEQALELVQWYRARWEIELFFLVLKEGCRVERLQFGHIERLMRLGRQLPELPADLLFDADEWHGAYILNRKKPPKEVPALNTVVRLVAQLGGFLGRKHDGELGAKTLCLGLREITIFVQSARFARDAGTCV